MVGFLRLLGNYKKYLAHVRVNKERGHLPSFDSWKSLLEGWLKINTDVSMLKGIAGLCWVVCDSNGRWLEVTTRRLKEEWSPVIA